VSIELRVQPKARRVELALKAGALKVAVTAAPEDGKANDAVIALLAETWRLPKSCFTVARGAASRDKLLSVAGEPDALAGRINEWIRLHG
jgi:uncharacterized protein YggU (UPF0235/DUF167 family)